MWIYVPWDIYWRKKILIQWNRKKKSLLITKTQALAVCHADTSGMNHEMLQQIMKADPGSKPVCHFLGNKAILWVPNLGLDNAYGDNLVV